MSNITDKLSRGEFAVNLGEPVNRDIEDIDLRNEVKFEIVKAISDTKHVCKVTMSFYFITERIGTGNDENDKIKEGEGSLAVLPTASVPIYDPRIVFNYQDTSSGPISMDLSVRLAAKKGKRDHSAPLTPEDIRMKVAALFDRLQM